ncbi:MAG: MFS transporter [Spirochaetes bacterium]|nr:MFS transporter [Spirochaetota bacterium]
MGNIKKPEKKINNPFAALKHINFRLYWIGFCISVIGTWMQGIAQPWLAYSLTNSPFLLSLVGVVQTVPVFLLTIFAGVILDRYPRKKILLITQSVAFIVTFITALLIWIGWIKYWHILIAACLMGINNSVDIPARQSFYIELVEKNDLMNAIALCSSAFNVARIIGPLIAGFVMAYLSIALCFFINSMTFALMFFCIIFIIPLSSLNKPVQKARKNVIADIMEGLKYILNNYILLNTLLAISVIGIFAMNFNVLIPVLVKTVLKRDVTAFSFLMSFMGVGSLTGAMIIASTSKSGPKKFILNVVPFIIGGFLCLTALSNIFFIIGLTLVGTGLFTVMFTSSANTTMQLNIKEELRGRVMSVYILVFQGSGAFGRLLTGIIMDKFNVQTAYLTCGIMIVLFSMLLLIYKKRIQSALKLTSTEAA